MAANRSTRDWFVICAAVPVVAPENWLSRLNQHPSVLWAPSGEAATVCGVGVALALASGGQARFNDILEQSQRLWSRLETLAVDPIPFSPSPRLLGGFAFSEEGAATARWQGLGPAHFVLPRLTYTVARGQAVLALAVHRNDVEEPPTSPLRMFLQEALEQFQKAQSPVTFEAFPSVEVLRQSEEGARPYPERVSDIVQQIASGKLDKVMAAREIHLQTAQPVDPMATVFALRTQAPSCLRFAFGTAHSTFLGATPERLVRKRGLEIDTEALAGTLSLETEDAETKLKASSKDSEEHQWVVGAIEEVLSPLCSRVDRPQQPRIRRLRHLIHLCTPITATLRTDTHILKLVERLHPTPAVGGVPRDEARKWIEQNEPFDRGWYAGTVGWFDASGDGAFNVALRSGLLHGTGISLYAGAGVVKDSAPDTEHTETTLKLTSLRSALRSGCPK